MIKGAKSERIDTIASFLMDEPSVTQTEGSRGGSCEASKNVLISEQWNLWECSVNFSRTAEWFRTLL
jgi:hypothetical protein